MLPDKGNLSPRFAFMALWGKGSSPAAVLSNVDRPAWGTNAGRGEKIPGLSAITRTQLVLPPCGVVGQGAGSSGRARVLQCSQPHSSPSFPRYLHPAPRRALCALPPAAREVSRLSCLRLGNAFSSGRQPTVDNGVR